MNLRPLIVFSCVLLSIVFVEGGMLMKKKVSSIHREKRAIHILDIEKFHLYRAVQNFGSPAELLAVLNQKQIVNQTEGILIRCEKCSPESTEQCPVPGALLWVHDTKTFPEDPERALHSLPPGLVVKESGIPGAGLGVWTVQDIPACTLFGPYEGEVVSGEQAKSSGSYAWQVSIDRQEKLVVDAANKAKSNWMRYVNCPEFEHEQNVVPFEFEGEMYYRTHSRVPAGTELLIWYGNAYANELKRLRDLN